MTEETKHTQGPWTITSGIYRVGVGNLIIADCNIGHKTSETLHANARLISAAPDLLEALEGALAFIGYGAHVPEIVERAEAAIAKATGTQETSND